MSQKGEKYARRMERRVDKLEQDVAAITTEQTTQGVRISAVEDDLAVYRAAVSARELFQSTRPVRGATPPSSRPSRASLHFNPRAPRGARRAAGVAVALE